MMRKACGALLVLGLLAGCGLEGAPKRPPAKEPAQTSVTVTGGGYVGVSSYE